MSFKLKSTNLINMIGFQFGKYDPRQDGKPKFDQLLDVFMQLLTYTSGDVGEALQWMNQLDKEYKLTDGEYGMGDFIEDLKDKGYIDENKQTGSITITPKTEQGIRKRSLEEIFGKLKKTKQAIIIHSNQEAVTRSIRKPGPFSLAISWNILILLNLSEMPRSITALNHFNMQEDDLKIRETDFKTQTSTVLMIDISHSMILYGEDRITPAKKVAMALSELITTKYPKDTLDIVVFGNDAWPVEIKDLPYLAGGALSYQYCCRT